MGLPDSPENMLENGSHDFTVRPGGMKGFFPQATFIHINEGLMCTVRFF